MSNGIDIADRITKLCSKALDIIFISSPKRTSFGVLLGVIFKGGTDIILQLIDKPISTTYFFWISIGVLLLHIPDFCLKHRVDEELETMMHYLLEAQKHGEFTQTEIRTQWRQFIKLIHERTVASIETGKKEKTEDKSTDTAPV